MNKIIFVISLLCLISCKKEGAQTTQIITPQTQTDSVTTTTIVLKDGTLLVSDWVELANFQEELKSVASKNIATEKELEQIINLLSKLKETIPEKFKTPTINARIKVIETELLMMNQFVKEQDFKSADTRKIRFQKAYNLFVNQIEALLIKEKDYEKYK